MFQDSTLILYCRQINGDAEDSARECIFTIFFNIDEFSNFSYGSSEEARST